MNEVTKVHLGRQPFTIAVDAHKALRIYLAAIEKQAGNNSEDVIKEVELRMAELLGERGVTGDKVILMDDVDYLKQQLGSPKDFKEDDSQEPEAEDMAAKKLFRDSENGIISGVAAGLSNYFGIDPLLVRLFFVIGVVTGGWGILAYIVLWLLVPEAKSSSDRLQMQGKAVTIESLKETVDRADIHGAAQRASGKFVSVVNGIFTILLKVVGIGFILAGLSSLFGLIAAKVYAVLHHGALFQENLFPVGRSEILLFNLGLVLAGILSIFVVLMGMAMFARKWPVRGWVSGVLLGIFLIGLAVAVALSGDAAPRVRDRYNASQHSITRNLQPFSDIELKGNGKLSYIYRYDNNYSVKIHYVGNVDASVIKSNVTDGKLIVDTSQFHGKVCNMLCLFPNNDLEITIYAPSGRIIAPPGFEMMRPNPLYYQ